MLSITRTRLALSAAAAAAVVGGLFVAAPANAATGEISLANSTFTAGDWGTGLDVSGSGFTADTTVTITVSMDFPAVTVVLGQQDVTADATGSFANVVFTPSDSLPLPALGQDAVVQATSSDGDTSNSLVLDVRAPKGIAASTTTISTADLTNPDVGIQLVASGYTPGENVALSSTFNRGPMPAIAYVADHTGTVHVSVYLAQGTAEAGQIEFTLTGASSGVANSITITVTGDTINTGPPQVVPMPAPAPAPGPTGTLPRVSG